MIVRPSEVINAPIFSHLYLATCVTLVASLYATPLFATIIHVPADQPTIQAGINAASNGDAVLAAPGTYALHTETVIKELCKKACATTSEPEAEETLCELRTAIHEHLRLTREALMALASAMPK